MFEDVSGAELAAVVAATAVAELSGEHLVDFLTATSRLIGWAQSRQLDAVAKLAYRHLDRANPTGVGDPASRTPAVSEFASAEIAAALGYSRPRADRLLDLALFLQPLPDRSECCLGRPASR